MVYSFPKRFMKISKLAKKLQKTTKMLICLVYIIDSDSIS